MKRDEAFTKYPLNPFDLESQQLVAGLRQDDFHVQVPTGVEPDVIQFLPSGEMRRSHERIGEEEIRTSYRIFPTSDGFIFQQGRGLKRYRNKIGEDYTAMEHKGEEIYPVSPYWSRESSKDRIWVDANLFKGGEFPTRRRSLLEIESKKDVPARITQEVDLPVNSVLKDFGNGLLVDMGDSATDGIRFKYLNRDFKFEANPLVAGLNSLEASGNLQGWLKVSPVRNRVLFWKELPIPKGDNPESSYQGLFLASFGETNSMGEVRCEGHPLFDPQDNLSAEDLQFSPTSDLFVVLSPQGKDSLHLYLGVTREIEGRWRSEVFRIRSFARVFNHSLSFSRDGKSLVFVTIDKDGTLALVRALVQDLVADINRRYPDAKLDLDALKAEVK